MIVCEAAVVRAAVLCEDGAEADVAVDICGSVCVTASAAVVCIAVITGWLTDDVSVSVMILFCGGTGLFGGFIA